MPELQNLTNRLVSIQLNHGRTMHIPPKSLSGESDDALVINNAKLKKLVERHVIAILPAKKKSQPTQGRAKSKGKRASEGA